MLKTKFIFIYLILILLSSLTITNCSDDIVSPTPVDSSDFRYPFKDGSSWNYTVTNHASDIRPDSILHYFSSYPEIIINGTATILYDTVINSVVTKCFLDEFTFTSSGTLSKNRYYYINNDTSLILYARRQQHPATGILPLRKIRDPFDVSENDNPNKVYNNEIEILSDTLYSTLKYPMVTGTEWSYTINGYTTNKKYSGFENVNGPSGIISCMKVSVVYSYLPTTSTYNFYSKFGLIKSDIIYNDIVFTNIINPDGAGTFDLTNETIVTSFNIPSD